MEGTALSNVLALCTMENLEDSKRRILSSKLKIGNLFKHSKKYSLAKAVYLELIEAYPSDFRAYFNLAQTQAEIGENENAISNYKTVIELQPTLIEPYSSLAALYIKTDWPQLSIQYCRMGLNVQVNDSACLYNLNTAMRQLHQIREAITFTWSAMAIEKPMSLPEIPPHVTTGSSVSNNLTIVCVKWGTKYGSDYVNNLYHSVIKHSSADKMNKFVCFTDDSTGIVESIESVLFDEEISHYRSWWLKAQLFSDKLCIRSEDSVPPLLTGWVLYIDLDTVICNGLDFLCDDVLSKLPAGGANNMYVLSAEGIRNEARSCGINSSLMLWRAGHHTQLYSYLMEHYAAFTACIYKFDHYLEMMLFKHPGTTVVGDTKPDKDTSIPAYTSDKNSTQGHKQEENDSLGSGVNDQCSLEKFCIYLQSVAPGKVIDYASLLENAQQCRSKESDEKAEESESVDVEPSYSEVIGDAGIICFPLQPKPHEVKHAWVQRHWRCEDVES